MSTSQLELQAAPIPGPNPGPSPDKFFETMTAYQHTAVLKAAIELDLFSAKFRDPFANRMTISDS